MTKEEIDADPKLIEAYNDGFHAGARAVEITQENKMLRDEFAWAAMSGAVANHGITLNTTQAARASYALADAMMAERQK